MIVACGHRTAISVNEHEFVQVQEREAKLIERECLCHRQHGQLGRQCTDGRRGIMAGDERSNQVARLPCFIRRRCTLQTKVPRAVDPRGRIRAGFAHDTAQLPALSVGHMIIE